MKKKSEVLPEIVSNFRQLFEKEMPLERLVLLHVQKLARLSSCTLTNEDAESIQESVKRNGLADLSALALNSLPSSLVSQINADSLSETLSELYESVFEDVSKETHRYTVRMILKNVDQQAAEIYAERISYEASLYARWRRAFNEYDVYLRLLQEFTEGFVKQTSRKRKNRLLRDCLIRLQARAIQIGHEISSLIRSGYADGAFSRWRELHEIHVISLFLSKHGEGLVQRYLDYADASKIKLANAYANDTSRPAFKPPTKKQMKEANAAKKRLLNLYKTGDFLEPYGWAASVLPSRRGNPDFARIERDVKLDYLRPYYTEASQAIHASPFSLEHRVGLAFHEQHRVVLYGPTDFGFSQPVELAASAIFNITACLSNSILDPDRAFYLDSLSKLLDKVINTFAQLDSQIQRETRKAESTQSLKDLIAR